MKQDCIHDIHSLKVAGKHNSQNMEVDMDEESSSELEVSMRGSE